MNRRTLALATCALLLASAYHAPERYRGMPIGPFPAVRATLSRARTPTPTATAAPTEPAPALAVVGQLGGMSRAVATDGRFAYLSLGSRLLVLDIADPVDPALWGQTEPVGRCVDLAVHEGLVLAACLDDGLIAVDVSEPAAPQAAWARSYDGPVHSVAVADGVAYVGAADGLRTLDIGGAGAPVELGFAPLPQPALDVVVAGGIAYVTEGYAESGGNDEGGGLRLLDVSDPRRPAEIGYYAMNPTQASGPPRAQRVAVRDGLAYVTYRLSRQGGLRIVDVSDPAHPTEVGDYRDYISYVSAVVVPDPVSENEVYAYLATGFNAGLLALDVTDPAHPVRAEANLQWAAGDMALAGDTLLITDEFGGMRAVDIGDRRTPTQLGRFDALSDARRIHVHDGVAYVVDSLRRLWTVDLTAPESLTLLSLFVSEGNIMDLAAAGDRLYLAAETADILVLDVSDPAAPALLDTIELPYLANNIAVYEGYGYSVAGDYPSGWSLYAFEVSNPAATVEENALDYAAAGAIVAAQDGLPFVGTDALHVYDLEEPGAPQEAGRLRFPEPANALALDGGYAYVLTFSQLLMVDVSDPQRPRQVAAADVSGSPTGLAVADGLAYVSGGGRLEVFDVRRPSAISSIAALEGLWCADDVATMGGHAYLADCAGGLLSFVAPAFPTSSASPRGFRGRVMRDDATPTPTVTPKLTPTPTGPSPSARRDLLLPERPRRRS